MTNASRIDREQLAELLHAQWCAWMRHLFGVAVELSDGTVIIPVGAAQRWKRQASLRYADLHGDAERERARIDAWQIVKLLESDGAVPLD